jgi:hypothetical protein
VARNEYTKSITYFTQGTAGRISSGLEAKIEGDKCMRLDESINNTGYV